MANKVSKPVSEGDASDVVAGFPRWMMDATKHYIDWNTKDAIPAHDDGGFCDDPTCCYCNDRGRP